MWVGEIAVNSIFEKLSLTSALPPLNNAFICSTYRCKFKFRRRNVTLITKKKKSVWVHKYHVQNLMGTFINIVRRRQLIRYHFTSFGRKYGPHIVNDMTFCRRYGDISIHARRGKNVNFSPESSSLCYKQISFWPPVPQEENEVNKYGYEVIQDLVSETI